MARDPRVIDLLLRYEEMQEQGRPVAPEELCRGAPELLRAVRRGIADLNVGRQHFAPPSADDDPAAVRSDVPTRISLAPRPVAPGPQRAAGGRASLPPRLGRYRVTGRLGGGGFGVVYKGYDDELRRDVAIKVPHPERVARPGDVEAYLNEARTVAGLDHPHIVPVYDAGRTDDGLCFVVSKLIEGSDLKQRMSEGRPSFTESAALAAAVAEALHCAHHKGLVHRDVKPSNVLIDPAGKPYVADFGLALREEDVGKGSGFAGTPLYMSPEQARGEGHRVDGRSDVFSLGVVFYELLAGRRPFRGETREELLEQIRWAEARPPRQWDDAIPRELERICLKALAKRASDRYTTARDLADDLRHFLADAPQKGAGTQAGKGGAPAAAVPPSAPEDSSPIRVVPKGLRSFDAHDADFFLELLPGPRDREGLPDGVRFWKTRVEETDPDGTFAVGLIYGPSGCGKSSLVKAGLLPRLSDDVIAVYVEAAAEDTEARLLNGLRRRCPALPAHLGLKEALAALRREQGLPPGKKVLIVLDQLEQWLHARKQEEDRELVQALRQCDGGRVQCLALVRDDFWMAATRFMRELEVRLLEGQNSAAVDLFPPRHAEKVLTAFGRAFGALPENVYEIGKEQKQFVEQAVAGLAQEGKVICVRLALFAEMMKGRPWTPAALRDVGGTEGVGVTFLEETFSAATAPPEHRYHQKAARAVLQALLPEAGSDIKGHMRSQGQLLAASGYGGRPKEFDDLLRILDGELRLITPADPEGVAGGGCGVAGEGAESSPATRHYQLTHDYLVPSLRDWLTRKQKETRRGRAELLLADRAAVWNARPESRQLPSLAQWLQIRWHTRKKNCTPPQRKMMRRATRYHAVRGLALALVLVALSATGLMVRAQVLERGNAAHAAALVQRLLDAETPRVPDIVAEMDGYRGWTDPLLREAYRRAKPNSRPQLHASLALLPADADQREYLFGRLLDAEPDEVPVIRDALAAWQSELKDRLWDVVERPEKGQERRRLRAAAALAKYDPESPRWDRSAANLVSTNAAYLGLWGEALRPVSARLLLPLSDVFRDRKPERAVERTLAAEVLANYAAEQPQVLADLLMDADEKQFAVLFPKFQAHGERGLALLQEELDQKLPPDAKDDDREKLAKRQANAAVAFLRMDHPEKVWPLLKHDRDPRVRSYLIHRFGPLGADAEAIVRRLEEEQDLTTRRALILSLGPEEFGPEALGPEAKKLLVERLQETYRTAADPGTHASAEWLLRQWGEEAWLAQTVEAWKNEGQRKKRLEGIRQALARQKDQARPQWYVTGQGQTMVVIPGPVEFEMGSPSGEAGRAPNERQHRRRVGRSFAIAAAPVTQEQCRRFPENFELFHPKFEQVRMARYPEPTCPMGAVTWYEAAAYCNWLSKQEKIEPEEWCYEIDAKEQVTKLKANYLSLTGYRLPTEAEWEYACRAGAATSRYYGESAELLGKYAWHLQNSGEHSWPVGLKKPNDLGLFDTHGGVFTWCQEGLENYPPAQDEDCAEDKEGPVTISREELRGLRGGAFDAHSSVVRCAYRNGRTPWMRVVNVGLRPARTFR